jgi:uncharacterized protein with NAD-binding domain and iron-sulfur cluster
MSNTIENTKIFKILEFAALKERFSGQEIQDATGLKWEEIRELGVRYGMGREPTPGIFRSWQSPLSLMDYLDYIELKEAREGARKATWIAIASILISAFLASCSVVVGILGLFWKA